MNDIVIIREAYRIQRAISRLSNDTPRKPCHNAAEQYVVAVLNLIPPNTFPISRFVSFKHLIGNGYAVSCHLADENFNFCWDPSFPDVQ